MNADFESELGAPRGRYVRSRPVAERNRNLSRHLLWLAAPGDGLLVEPPFPERLSGEAAERGVELIPTSSPGAQAHRLFTPWGWTHGAIELGAKVGTVIQPVPPRLVKRVNSKLWSYALEVELGVALPGATVTASLSELREAVVRACPRPGDKWVIKSPFGFAARERVLGRGPTLEGPQATWAVRRLSNGEQLIFQPWLNKVREYGVVLQIQKDGRIHVLGFSDLLTNGAGTGIGYVLGRRPTPERERQLSEMAELVGARLFAEGYTGPAGLDALEHESGLHPLLEVNARYTMGFVALAVERALQPSSPTVWSLKPGNTSV
ncbi:MAG: hypothetical protein ACRD9R_20280 [Pyrinomonadaceae bacterium]